MRYLFTGIQSKELDNHAINTVGFHGLVLMEKAAMTLASVLMEREDKRSGILFVCGTGNNGGDGLAAARLMHQQGYRVAILPVGDAAKLSPDAKKQLELAAACDVPSVTAEALFSPVYDVVADGLFGVGLDRDITGVYEKVILEINSSGKKVYAIDVPSGINGNDGRVMNVAVKADITVTFGVNKCGLVLYPGCRYAGEVIIGDIGYPQASYHAIENPAYYYETDDLRYIIPKRDPEGHKGSFGCVSIIGGSRKMSGAALLSARAAYASGAGIVRVCSAGVNREIILTGIPEAIFTAYDGEEGEPDESVLDEMIRYGDVVVLGPGLGNSDMSKQIVEYVIRHCDKPLVLDGDGISLCQREELKGRKNVVITPHPKEFSRISGVPVAGIKDDLPAAVLNFSRETGCVVAGKDARTIVSDGKEVYVNVSGNSGMATGGSGDVLTGIIAGLAAQGESLFQAAKAGVYVHGLAGDCFLEKYNEYSLTASGLIENLKYVLNRR